jgi:hypothetical protein
MNRRLDRLVALGALVLCTTLISSTTQAGCPADAVTVNISVADDKITVPESEKSVTVYLDGAKNKTKVCWVVSGVDKSYTLSLYKKASTNGRGFFPGLTKKFKGSSGGANIERIGVPKKKGDWHYGIKLKKDGVLIDELDPTIIILGGKG